MITIQISDADLSHVRSMLSGCKEVAESVVMRAINKTLTGVKTDASTEVRNILNAKKKDVDEGMKITKATRSNNVGVFSSTGKLLPLMTFGARQTKAGVSVQVRKDGSRKVIPGAFIATMKSGHQGVFWRKWHEGKSGGKKRKVNYASLPLSYRHPIVERYGPRIQDYLAGSPIMDNVLRKAGERLHDNLEHELSFELSKL